MKLAYLQEFCFIIAIAFTLNPIQANANPIPEAENNELVQNNSVSELRDVEPKDWAYEALKNLSEKYNCIEGNANGFYLGNRTITRYEFATGLNTCLEKITPLINSGGEIQADDLDKIKQLQTQFSSELTALSTRLDSLEQRILPLEEQQFSTTTKLNGSAWINLTGVSTGDNIKFEALPNTPLDARFAGGRDSTTGEPLINTIRDSQTTLSSLVWLTLNTSFTGKDLLTVQLAAGNGASPINQFVSAGFLNTYGNPYTDQTSGLVTGKPDVVIQDLSYSFPLTDAVKLTLGPRVNWFNYFDFNNFTSYLNGASSYASVASTQSSATFWGSGAVLEWKISPQLMWKASYLGENIPYFSSEFGYNTSSNPDFGLFGGTNSTTSELTYSPTDKLNLRFRYNYTRLQAYGGQVGGGNAAPLPYGYLDAGPGFSVYDPATGTISSGGLDHAYSHTFAFNFDWLLNPKLGIFGRYSYGNINLEPINEAVNVQSWQVGMAFPDLGKKGALGVLTLVVPMDIQTGRQYFVAGGGDGGKIYELEASYYYPVNDNISLIPAFYAIFNPNNFNSNPNIYVGNVRLQFSF
ncbi:iron uptake porin [Anabaena azotica]|uniref:iron uptake porin n=1 Tax=Anabaena azotica TaxID=197653 RepID=UPI0039A6A5BF